MVGPTMDSTTMTRRTASGRREPRTRVCFLSKEGTLSHRKGGLDLEILQCRSGSIGPTAGSTWASGALPKLLSPFRASSGRMASSMASAHMLRPEAKSGKAGPRVWLHASQRPLHHSWTYFPCEANGPRAVACAGWRKVSEPLSFP